MTSKEYLRHYFLRFENKDGVEENKWCEEKLPEFMRDIEHCLILITFKWCIWNIVAMKEEEETNHTIFYWETCRMRIVLFNRLLEWFDKKP